MVTVAKPRGLCLQPLVVRCGSLRLSARHLASRQGMSVALMAAGLLLALDTAAAPADATVRADPAFNSELSANYMALSHAEYAQGDERDGSAYAARGQAAAQGAPGDPDVPALHQAYLKARYVTELTDARSRLMKSFGAGARSVAPAAAARAVVL